MLQYRNYSSGTFDFLDHITCITGPNGSGKTNLLDAVYYLCYTKSYFSSFQQHSVQNGMDGFRVIGIFNKNDNLENVSIKWKAGKKEIFANDAEYEKLSDHIGRFSAVMIAPDDTEIINGGSELRRKWIDSILGQVDKAYLEKLLRYQQILLQRNAWLKMHSGQQIADFNEIEFYNAELTRDGAYIYQQRDLFLTDFMPILEGFYKKLSGDNEQISVGYTSHLSQKPLKDWLEQSLPQDLRMQRTNKGIHKDDLDFKLNDMPLKQFGSQGQKKSFLFALKLSQYTFLSKALGHLPILLLDDIFEKLDQNRMDALLNIICSPDFGQVILTDTHQERIKFAFGNQKQVGYINL